MRGRFIFFLLIVLLGIGFYTIMVQRFATGVAYPHYASFRSDPLGTSVFYEALEQLENRSVSRNLVSLESIQTLDGDTALLLLGFPRDSLDSLRSREDSPVLRAVEAGARLVITVNPGLVPEEFQPRQDEKEKDWLEKRRKLQEESEKKPGEQKRDGQSEEELELESDRLLGSLFMTHFNLELTTPRAFKRPDEGWKAKVGPALVGPERESPPRWFSQYRLKTKDPAWKIGLMVAGEPVLLERRLGKGSIVIASDSYFLSNECLHLQEEADFLLWLIGDKKKVLFDETIHGTTQTVGVMKLIRKHRLYGILIGLLIWVALWAWRSASPLIPAAEDVEAEAAGRGKSVLGRDTKVGLVNLLRRSIPESELLSYCFTIWRQNRVGEASQERLEQTEAIIQAQQSTRRPQRLVAAYREISQILRKN